MSCGICGEDHNYSDCSLVTIKNHISDSVVPSKARLTLPASVNLQAMADGTQCVVANASIEKGTKFGPLEAQKLLTLNPVITFPLKLFNDDVEDLSEYYLDTCDEYNSNWLIFIAAAQTLEEQNLICFQEQSKIFYVAIKDINVGAILYVWYSPYYAIKMQKSLLAALPQVMKKTEEAMVRSFDLNQLMKKQQNIMERDNWICKFCGKLENNVILFATHMLEHYGKKLNKRSCEFCKQSFPNQRSLRRHVKKTHGKEPLIEKDLRSVNVLNEKDVPIGGPLLNDLLNDSLDNTNLLPDFGINNLETQLLEGDTLSLNVDNLLNENVKELDHFNFEIDESQEQHVCDVCLKSFTKLTYLIQHLKIHTGKYTCRYCLKIFCRLESLTSHNCNNNKKLPQFVCSLCQRGFMLRKYLVRHMTAIHDRKNMCKNCHRVYHSSKEMTEHNCSAVSDSNKPTFACIICNKTFFRDSYLKRHMLAVHSARDKKVEPKHKFICDVCANVFLTNRGLELHMRTHSEYELSCETCDKKFCRRDVLQIHKATHGDAKEVCRVCDAKLKTKQSLAIHMRLHSGIKPQKCQQCSEEFRQRSSLVQHVKKVHLKMCTVCSKTFDTVELLKKHKVTHNFKIYFVCPLCKKKIKLRSSLRRHLKQFHKGEDADQIMLDVKPMETHFNQKEFDVVTEKMQDENERNLGVGFNDNIVSFENIMGDYKSNSNDLVASAYDALEMANESNEGILDFNDLEIDLEGNFEVQQNLNREVCLSMPDLTEADQEITLGENAYMLEDGTIVEPKEQGNVLVYVLGEKKFV